MANTYTWTVVAKNPYSQPGVTEPLVMVSWEFEGTDGTYVGGVWGATPVVGSVNDTDAQLIAGVQAVMGPTQEAAYQEYIDEQIAAKTTPPINYPPLPWYN